MENINTKHSHLDEEELQALNPNVYNFSISYYEVVGIG